MIKKEYKILYKDTYSDSFENYTQAFNYAAKKFGLKGVFTIVKSSIIVKKNTHGAIPIPISVSQ